MKRDTVLKIVAISLFFLGLFATGATLLLNGRQSGPLQPLTYTEHKTELNPGSLTPDQPESEEKNVSEPVVLPEEQNEKSEDKPSSAEKPILPLPKLPILGAPKQHSDDILRIGFLTDPHIWSEAVGNTPSQKKIGPVYIQKINHFLRQMNDVFGPDIIIINGDVIEGTKISSAQGREELHQAKMLFDQTAIPKYWVIGNHDVRSVTKPEWKEALSIDYLHVSFVSKGHRIIMVDSNFGPDGDDAKPGNSKLYTRGFVAKQELDWLRQELDTPEPKIVFLHHPPTRSNPGKPDSGILRNADELRALFVGKNVKAVFGGHIEKLQAETQDDTNYFVFPGMTKSPAYAGNFVSISIDEGGVKTEMSYIGPGGKYQTMKVQPIPVEKD